jgi:hypothetical protein
MARGGKRAGAGRPKASLNRATRSLKDLAQEFTAESIRGAISIMRSRKASNSARLEAIKIILDRGHGKPRQEMDVELGGKLTLEQLVLGAVAAKAEKDAE